LKIAKQVAVKNKENIKVGIIGSSDYFPVPAYLPEDFENSKISAIDMESAAFHQVCDELGKPGIVIRGISNRAFENSHVVKIKKEDINCSTKNTTRFVVDLIGAYYISQS
jgi:nucleoside phosphorylase